MCSCIERYLFSCVTMQTVSQRVGFEQPQLGLPEATRGRWKTYAETSLAAIGTILICQWAYNLTVGVRGRKRAGEGRPRWHDRPGRAKRDAAKTSSDGCNIWLAGERRDCNSDSVYDEGIRLLPSKSQLSRLAGGNWQSEMRRGYNWGGFRVV